MSHPAHKSLNEFAHELGRSDEAPIQKWEFWSDGRRRSQTICILLRTDELSIAHRGIDSTGCMSEFGGFGCDLEHLPQLVRHLNRALLIASSRGLIKPGRRPPSK